MHENREISSAPSVIDEGRSVKAPSRTTDTHALEKSDCAVLPVNRPSKGAFIVWRKTAKKRMVAKLRAVKAELRHRMHEPIASVGEWLHKVVMGYYRYHAVPGNLHRLRVFGQRLRRLWRLILSRHNQRGMLPWDRLKAIFARWIPVPRVVHPYPMERFLAHHPRWEPYA